jgi:hypothetical protein
MNEKEQLKKQMQDAFAKQRQQEIEQKHYEKLKAKAEQDMLHSIMPSIGSNVNWPSLPPFPSGGIGQNPYNGNGGICGSPVLYPNQTTAYPSLTPAALTPNYKWGIEMIWPKHLFAKPGTVVPVLENDSTYPFMFHISVWIECCKPDSNDYGIVWEPIVYDLNSLQSQTKQYRGCLLIKEGKTLDRFNDWWPSYQNRFSGDTWRKQSLPTIIEGDQINGYPIKHGYKGSSLLPLLVPDDLYAKWLWIVQNTQEQVWCVDEYWIFADKGELIMYKLTEDIHVEKEEKK